jgi:hypothetical protein
MQHRFTLPQIKITGSHDTHSVWKKNNCISCKDRGRCEKSYILQVPGSIYKYAAQVHTMSTIAHAALSHIAVPQIAATTRLPTDMAWLASEHFLKLDRHGREFC